MALYYYDDGGNNTAPYDTFVKAAPALATIIAVPLAVGEHIRMGNDTAGEALGADTTYTFPGTTANPNYLVSVDRINNNAPLAGGIISAITPKTITINGSVYIFGVTFNLATTTAGNGYLKIAQVAGNACVLDTCKIVFVGSGAGSYFAIGTTTVAGRVLIKNTTIKYSNAAQRITVGYCNVIIDGLIIDPASSAAPTGLISTLQGYCSTTIIQNSDLSAGAQGIVLLPATASGPLRVMVRNCKLPANWNGTLVAGGAITSIHYRAEMYNCDSGDTNYRILINDYYAQLVQETTLVAASGATDGTTRLSWKVVTTANANQVNPFYCPEMKGWNDTEGTQRKCTVEIIHNCAALLNNNEAWLDVDASQDTGDPLYAKSTNKVADLEYTAPAAQTASTKAWDDLVTVRANNHAYSLGDLIKSTNNVGRVFICTTAGTSTSSEPAGYGTAVDGGTVADGATCVFTAMYRQKLTVTLPAGKPANKGEVLGIVKIAKASSTVYVDRFMLIEAV